VTGPLFLFSPPPANVRLVRVWQSLDTRDTGKSTRHAIIKQEVQSIRQENNRLFNERNRVRDQCATVRHQLWRLRENLARVCFSRGETVEAHLARIGVHDDLFYEPGSLDATMSKTALSHHSATPLPTDGMQATRSFSGGPTSNAIETGMFLGQAEQAKARVASLDTPAALGAVAAGASLTGLLETGKRAELENIVAQLVNQKQAQLDAAQFRVRLPLCVLLLCLVLLWFLFWFCFGSVAKCVTGCGGGTQFRQLKHMETRARDQLRNMQHSIQKANRLARELVRLLQVARYRSGDVRPLT